MVIVLCLQCFDDSIVTELGWLGVFKEKHDEEHEGEGDSIDDDPHDDLLPGDGHQTEHIKPGVGLGGTSPEPHGVTQHAQVNDEVLAKLLPLAKWVVRLDIRDTSVTNQVGGTLSQFSALVELNLRGCQIGDQGVSDLAVLQNLQSLNLGNTEVSKDGVAKLLKLPALTTLNLWQSKAGTTAAQFDQIRSGLRIIY